MIKKCMKCDNEFSTILETAEKTIYASDRKICFSCMPYEPRQHKDEYVKVLECDYCEKTFTKYISNINRTEQSFCSKECCYEARVQHIYQCELCNQSYHLIADKHSSKKYCQTCYPIMKKFSPKAFHKSANADITIKELYNKFGKFRGNVEIRRRNRRQNKELLLSCVLCGYDKHIELAHIQAVAIFDKNTKISEINARDNSIPLCSNHHYELDNELMDETDIAKIKEWIGIRKEMIKPAKLDVFIGKPFYPNNKK